MASNYEHGTMNVSGHNKTYAGFMSGSIWGGGLIILVCLYPTLVFGTSLGWLASLIITMIIGILYGLALKMKGGWFATVIGLTIFAAILSAIIAAIA